MVIRTGVLRPSHQALRARGRAGGALFALVFAVLFVVLGAVMSPSVAHAQNDLVTSEPADGAVLAESPDEVVLTFAEAVGNRNNVSVACNGQPFTAIAQPVPSNDSQTLTVEVRQPMPSGTCTVAWGVSQEDGRPGADGSFSFSVESGAPGTAPSDAVPDDEDEEEAGAGNGDEGGDGDGDGGDDDAGDGDAGDEGDESVDGGDESADEGDESAAPDEEAEPDDDEADAEAETDESGGGDGSSVGDIGSGGSDGSLWVGRVLSTVGMSVVLGALVLLAVAWPEGPEYVIAVRFIRSAWIVAVIGTVVYVAAATASATGESFGSSVSPLEWGDLADAGWPGRAALARLLLVLATGWVVALPERAVQPTTQLAGLAIPLLAVATLGLSRTDGDLVALGVVMGVLHAVAMAVWLGGVIFVSRIVLAGSGGDDLVHATRGFSRLAMPALIVTVLTGLVQLFRLDGGTLFSEPHGRVLLLKSLFVAALLFVAVAVQQIVQARLTRARAMDLRVADRLRRAFGVDAAIGVIVVGLTGWMLTYDPGNLEAETPASEDDPAIEELVENEDANIRLSVAVSPGVVGNNDIVVRVFEPEEGLSALRVTFVPPAGSGEGSIEQDVPLNGRGMAVLAPNDEGIPFNVAGTWTLEVSGSTDSGAISGTQARFVIRNEDGSVPDSRIDQPGDDETDQTDPDETDQTDPDGTDPDSTDEDGGGGGDGENNDGDGG